MARHMAQESTLTRTEPHTRVRGWLTDSMEMAWNHGPMALLMRVLTLQARSMVSEGSSCGLITQCMRDSSGTITLRDWVDTHGLMVAPMRVSGKRTRCMDRVCSSGQSKVERSIRVNTDTIRSTVME